MGETSFLVCAPPEAEAPFRAHEGAWHFHTGHVMGLRETLRIASKWLRREWKPDFSRDLPFGPNRHLALRRRGDDIRIHRLDVPGGPAVRHDLEFHYVELPGLRSSVERYLVYVRRRSVTTPQGEPHGATAIYPDR